MRSFRQFLFESNVLNRIDKYNLIFYTSCRGLISLDRFVELNPMSLIDAYITAIKYAIRHEFPFDNETTPWYDIVFENEFLGDMYGDYDSTGKLYNIGIGEESSVFIVSDSYQLPDTSDISQEDRTKLEERIKYYEDEIDYDFPIIDHDNLKSIIIKYAGDKMQQGDTDTAVDIQGDVLF